MKELGTWGPSNPRVRKRFQGGGRCVELGGEGTSWVVILYLKRGTVRRSSSEGRGNRGDLESGGGSFGPKVGNRSGAAVQRGGQGGLELEDGHLGRQIRAWGGIVGGQVAR